MDFFVSKNIDGTTAPMRTTLVFDWNWEQFQNDECRTIVNQGGTSSGKTYSICQCILLWAFQNPNKTVTITGQDLPQITRDVLREFQKVIKSSILNKVKNGRLANQLDYEYNKSRSIYTLHNGTTIQFVAYGDAHDAKGKHDLTYIFECYNVDYEIYKELAIRTTYKIVLCYNPSARFWAHEKVIPLSDSSLIISNFQHNDYLSENIRNEILSYNDATSPNYDPYRWQVLGLGKTGQISGLCFPKCYQVTDKEFPTDPKKTCYGLDWGFNPDPFVLCQLSLYDGKLYVRELVYETGLLNTDISKRMIELGVPKDALIIADRSPQNIADLKRLHGWQNIRSSKGREITFGINKLNEQNLYITNESTNAWIEQQNYMINPKTKKPIDKFNHFWDACRYAYEGLFNYSTPATASRGKA